MDPISYKTVSANKNTVEREWFVIDATDLVLGRLASRVASVLRGKHKPYYTPNTDCGDHVIVLNAGKARLTGRKWQQKEYLRHTGYPGGLRRTKASEMRDTHPERLIEKAVQGMLPKSRLGRQMYKKLHVVAGDEHAYESRQPKKLEL